MLSLPHLLIVVVIVLLVFGTGRLPRLMEDMGKGINAFKKGLNGEDEKQKLAAAEQERQKLIEDKTEDKTNV